MEAGNLKIGLTVGKGLVSASEAAPWMLPSLEGRPLCVHVGWGGWRDKKGGRAFFNDGVYHEDGSLTVPAPFHSPPPTPGSLVTLQIKFPTFEFGRTPSNPSKGFATPSAVGVNLSVEEHIV